MSDPEASKVAPKLPKWVPWAGGFVVLAYLTTPLIAYFVSGLGMGGENRLVRMGQLGDTFGMLNALMGCLSVGFLGWTLYDQRRAIEDQRKENAEDKHLELFLKVIDNIKEAKDEVSFTHGSPFKGRSFFTFVPEYLGRIQPNQIEPRIIVEVREIAKQLAPIFAHVAIAARMAKDDELMQEMLSIALPKGFKATINAVMQKGIQSKKVESLTAIHQNLPKWLWDKLDYYESAN